MTEENTQNKAIDGAQKFIAAFLKGHDKYRYPDATLLLGVLNTIGCRQMTGAEMLECKLKKPEHGTYYTHDKANGAYFLLPSRGRITGNERLQELRSLLGALQTADIGTASWVEKAKEAGKKPGGRGLADPDEPGKHYSWD